MVKTGVHMTTIPGFNDTPELKREREIANIENLLECGYGRTNKPLSQRRRQELIKRLIELKQCEAVSL